MDTIWQPELLQTDGPKYKAVVHAIRDQIETRHLASGDKLPPVRDLAWKLGITPGTVARAYTILTDDGTLTAEVGRGTFVAKPDRKMPLLPDIPLEVDSTAHNSDYERYQVNLFSPHLPSVGHAQHAKRRCTGCPARRLAPSTRAIFNWLTAGKTRSY
jgi:DNA-binding transcriptional regulator YhcF (GntR family)